MLKSMTGYGRSERIEGGKKISAEIKSVNHRYSDYSIKVPRYYGFLEDKIRKKVSEYISRGKVDIYIGMESYTEDETQISLKEDYAKNYINILYELKDKFGLKDDITVTSVARNQDIFNFERKTEDEEYIWSLVEPVITEALETFSDMRTREGGRIEADLIQRVEYMKTMVKGIEERSPKTVEEYRERLYAKLKELLEDKNIDENRILTEAAVFADKVAVNEETVRLASHFEEFYDIVSKNEPAGRKLDFLIQEINRETNTIGSKANDTETAKTVVELKAETEKLREQIQNVE